MHLTTQNDIIQTEFYLNSVQTEFENRVLRCMLIPAREEVNIKVEKITQRGAP